MSNCNRVAGYQGNVQKSIAFQYTSNEQCIWNLKHSSIYINTPKNAILRYKSNKIFQDLYEKIYKILMKEIKAEL